MSAMAAAEQGLIIGWRAPRRLDKPPVGFVGRERAPQTEPPPAEQLILHRGEGHLMTIAPTRAGKGRGLIIPNLLHYPGPTVTIDPKGENLVTTRRYRLELGQEVVALDPFAVAPFGTGALNPFDMFSLESSIPESDAFMLTDMLMTARRGRNHHRFWDDLARSLIAGAIHWIAHERPATERNLGTLYDTLAVGSVQRTLKRILKGETQSKFAIDAFEGFLANTEIVQNDTLSFVRNHLQFLADEPTRASLGPSTIALEDIIEGKPISLYMVVPPKYLKSHGRLLRMWVGVLLLALQERQHKLAHPTLFLLDECARLGRLSILEEMVTLMAGYDVRVWMFFQDLAQLRRTYPAEWRTMVNQCDVVQAFGVRNRLMAMELAQIMSGRSAAELGAMPKSHLVQVRDGRKARIHRRPDYRADAMFAGRFDENPRYLARSIERRHARDRQLSLL
jgi:type IV secretion system protein VirD4